jgi:hypothetical protein
MTTDWMIRIGDGSNFEKSSKYKIWGVQSTTPDSKYIIANIRPGDILWFIKGNNSKGLIFAVATYRSCNKREFGPLLDVSMTNEELGWTNEETKWTSDTEFHYADLYNVSNCELLTGIKGPKTIRKYNEQKCDVQLPVEYNNIFKYRNITTEF